jgi:hypothetical protein
LTQRAIEAGHRASEVVGESSDTLRQLLEVSQTEADRPETESIAELADDDWQQHWLDAANSLDGESLQIQLRHAWNRLGGLDFLRRRRAPAASMTSNPSTTGPSSVPTERGPAHPKVSVNWSAACRSTSRGWA